MNRIIDCLVAFSSPRNFKSPRSSKISDRFLTYPVALCQVTYPIATYGAIGVRFNVLMKYFMIQQILCQDGKISMFDLIPKNKYSSKEGAWPEKVTKYK